MRAQSNLGWYLLLAGKFEDAEKVLQRVWSVEPANVYVHINLARSKRLLRNFKSALELYKVRIGEVIGRKF